MKPPTPRKNAVYTIFEKMQVLLYERQLFLTNPRTATSEHLRHPGSLLFSQLVEVVQVN